jgi:cysteinyl-tRNA synthetase
MKLYNSLTRKKEEFISIDKNKIKMYVCGQTVYDYCHLGHARKAVVFDMIRRWFIASGYEVLFVENITDIDDKIIKRADENNESITELTNRVTTYMYEDFDRLDIMRADVQPKATDYVGKMLSIIQNLVDKGYAYHAKNGDVYYSVRKFKEYGKLSGRSVDDLQAGARIEVDFYKKDPLDFVLWKASKANEPYWESVFGNGRPGWHIECSAMSEDILGSNFDIHGGGQDLQFPHHENEIAQSEAHNDCTFANYWLHNGFLNIDDEKMSKSLGNFLTLRDVLNQYDPEVVRIFMLKTHYRSPLNFDADNLSDAKHTLTRLYTAIKPFNINSNSEIKDIDWSDNHAKKFKEAMDDDFNTPLAISILFELIGEVNKNNNEKLAILLMQLAKTLGLLNRKAEDFMQSGASIATTDIETLISKRSEAKANKDFITSDKIRDDLLANGIILEDSTNGTTWRKT